METRKISVADLKMLTVGGVANDLMFFPKFSKVASMLEIQSVSAGAIFSSHMDVVLWATALLGLVDFQVIILKSGEADHSTDF